MHHIIDGTHPHNRSKKILHMAVQGALGCALDAEADQLEQVRALGVMLLQHPQRVPASGVLLFEQLGCGLGQATQVILLDDHYTQLADIAVEALRMLPGQGQVVDAGHHREPHVPRQGTIGEPLREGVEQRGQDHASLGRVRERQQRFFSSGVLGSVQDELDGRVAVEHVHEAVFQNSVDEQLPIPERVQGKGHHVELLAPPGDPAPNAVEGEGHCRDQDREEHLLDVVVSERFQPAESVFGGHPFSREYGVNRS